MLTDLFSRWPLIQQIRTGANGNGVESMSERTRNLRPKTDGAEVARSICPYCGVGCTLTLHEQDGEIVKSTSPLDNSITLGNLCIKGRFGWRFVQPGGR